MLPEKHTKINHTLNDDTVEDGQWNAELDSDADDAYDFLDGVHLDDKWMKHFCRRSLKGNLTLEGEAIILWREDAS